MWGYRVLLPRLLRMAGEPAIADELERATGERLWEVHFYGYAAVEDLGRKLPGFQYPRPQPDEASDLYAKSLDASRRIWPSADPRCVTTLLCGLRYHPELAEVVEEIHTYANSLRGQELEYGQHRPTPDWREPVPGDGEFGSEPIAVSVGRMPLWLRATGSQNTRLVWRLYQDENGTQYVGDVEFLGCTSSPQDRYGRLATMYVSVRGKRCQVKKRR